MILMHIGDTSTEGAGLYSRPTMRVCVQERVDIVPGKVEAYYAALEQGWDRVGELGGRCMGVWHTAGATGKWHEVYFLWEFEDYSQYTSAMEAHGGPGGLVHWVDADWKLRTGGSSYTLEPAAESQGVQGKLFMHEYIRVLPGKRREYIKHYVEDFLPATRRAGREMVGIWAMTANANDVSILLALKDWQGHAEGMGNRTPDPMRQAWQGTAPHVRTDYDLRLLEPGPKALNPLVG